MGFLRRLLGGESSAPDGETPPADVPTQTEDDERARDPTHEIDEHAAG